MARDLPSSPELVAAGEHGRAGDEPDPELLALPDPPRRERTLTLAVLALASVAAVAMVFALRRDVAYALASSSPAPLGDLRTASDASLVASENRLVRAEGMVGVAGGIRYERPFAEDTFRTLPIAGRGDAWVDVRVPAGQENGRWEPPREFSGRLVRFSAAGPRHRGLARAIEETTRERVADGAWLVVDGEQPADARWAILLAAMFIGFAGWNAWSMVKIVRRVS